MITSNILISVYFQNNNLGWENSHNQNNFPVKLLDWNPITLLCTHNEQWIEFTDCRHVMISLYYNTSTSKTDFASLPLGSDERNIALLFFYIAFSNFIQIKEWEKTKLWNTSFLLHFTFSLYQQIKDFLKKRFWCYRIMEVWKKKLKGNSHFYHCRTIFVRNCWNFQSVA